MTVMCGEGWSSHTVWGAKGRIETLAGAYFGYWYQSFSVISSLPRLLTTVEFGRHTYNMCWGYVVKTLDLTVEYTFQLEVYI